MAFSQHDWLNDYFHFCLCWQRWRKDYIPVEGRGDINLCGQIRLIVNQITCFRLLLSSKTNFHGLGLCPVVSSSAFRQVRMIHSCSSSSKMERKRRPNITISHLLFALPGSSSNNFSFEEKISVLSHWHLLEHIFVSWKDFVLLCWNVSRQETLNTWQWFWVLSYLIGLTWAELKFMLFLEFLWPFTGNLLKISEVKLHIFKYYVCIACQVMKSEGNGKSTVKA